MRYVVLGATGSVGRVILRLLADRMLVSPKNVEALASERSAGSEVSMGEEAVLKVKAAETFVFEKDDMVFSAARANVASCIVPKALKAGAWVIDKSTAFRQKAPLIVPEVNGDLLQSKEVRTARLISSPNCVVIPLVLAVHPLAEAFGLKSLVVSTYQAVSGAGKKGLDTLYAESKQVLMAQPPQLKDSPFPQQIAFNVLPQIGALNNAGISDEEDKIQSETKSILCKNGMPKTDTATDTLDVVATAVRVPTFMSHGISVVATFNSACTSQRAAQLWQAAEGVVYRRDRLFTPMDAAGEDSAFITRLRQVGPRSLAFWVVCDNLLKGAALNAIQIAETVRAS